MGDNLISINFANWVTVLLMGAVGLAIVALICQGLHMTIPGFTSAVGGSAANPNSPTWTPAA